MKTRANRFLLFFLVVISEQTLAQSFEWAAQVPAVDKAGFYAVPLAPKVVAKTNIYLSDVRLYSDKGLEVPYVLKKEQPSFDKQLFTEFPLQKKEIVEGCCTRIILQNPKEKAFDNFCLLVKNHDLSKFATLKGSNDKNIWYALKEGIVFNPLNGFDETFGICYVRFPYTNYRYFSLEINDSATAPLNILHVGNYDSEVEFGKLILLPSPTILHADSAKTKKTYVTLRFDEAYAMDQLEVRFKGPKFFSRQAELYAIYQDEKGKRQLQWIQSFHLDSKSPTQLVLENAKFKEYRIEIDNGDNPTLRLDLANAFQLNTYLLTYLEANTPYTLKFGNGKLQAPQYDLSAFVDSVPKSLTELNLGPIISSPKPIVKAIGKESYFQTNWWIWGAIAIVLGFLAWMSAKMIKEMGKDA